MPIIFLELYWALEQHLVYVSPQICALVLLTEAVSLASTAQLSGRGNNPSGCFQKEPNSVFMSKLCVSLEPWNFPFIFETWWDLRSIYICAASKLWGVNIPCGQTLTNKRKGSESNFFLPKSAQALWRASGFILPLWRHSANPSIQLQGSSGLLGDILSSVCFLVFPASLLLPWDCTSQYIVITWAFALRCVLWGIWGHSVLKERNTW